MTNDRIPQPTMSPADFRRAQDVLGLTDYELAKMLGFGSSTHVRRLQATPDKKHHRAFVGPGVRLVEMYLRGYRPPDWPRKKPGM